MLTPTDDARLTRVLHPVVHAGARHRLSVALLLAFLMLSVAACAGPVSSASAPSASDRQLSSSYALDSAFTLRVGEEVTLTGANLRLKLVDVTGDSRCPVDVTCVWAGDALVHVDASVGKDPATSLTLHASPGRGGSAVVGRYSVSLRALLPRPLQGKKIAPDEYRAELVVSEADKGKQE